ncbi:Os08g0406450 [Oryza sativa Japonica Group]|uniref:Os08g0406450 protein n=1 Tax=Oryza sativa subsp. japonica TaxID=39947 RepID=A0A0P0XFT3_ORYSJ|nr:hypothetical protein EE612_044205 [Oryza sativa]BAT05369.1 Os08g0406450 [Oryza sativa Japonica Group]
MIIDPRIAFGVYLKSGVMTNKVRSTTADIMILDTGVWQPAMKLTAEREKEPDTNQISRFQHCIFRLCTIRSLTLIN